MTTVKKIAKDMILNYNSCYASRWRVLHYLFFTLGTGNHWSGGSIYQESYLTKAIKKPYGVSDFLKDFDKNVAWSKANPHCSVQKEDSIIELHRKFHIFHAEFVVENIDELSSHIIAIEDENLPKLTDIDAGNHLFWNPPEELDKDWRKALIEAGTIMSGIIKEKHSKTADSGDVIWQEKGAKKLYLKMVSHVEAIKNKTYRQEDTVYG